MYDLEERIESRFEELLNVLAQVVREESLEDFCTAMREEVEDFERRKSKDKGD